MKAFLMHRDRDFELRRKLPFNDEELIQDLELDTLINAMAGGDKFLLEVVKQSLLSGLNNDPDTILYRQHVLKDCQKNPSIIKDIYDIAVESMEAEKKHYYGFFKYPGSILHRSIEVMQLFVRLLRKLKSIADQHDDKFDSEGFRVFFAMVKKELGEEYFDSVQNHLNELKFRNGVLISAELGKGNKGANYILRKPYDRKQGWLERIFSKKPTVYTFYIAGRDESGFRALSEIKDRGINLAANALAQSTDHILSFFIMLRTELAFYVACLNLQEQLARIEEPVALPLPLPAGERRHSFKGLYDVCLALTKDQKIVGNDMKADEKGLAIITGANQGGKSVFLRSIGLSQLMMQCGMFVPAETFSSNVCDGLFTHYKREEDVSMKSGKLDEELGRMSAIVDNLTPNSMVLFNESFAATNEREGSEIARQIVLALLEKRIKVFYVTHLTEFARGFYDQRMESTIFLRAERQADGERTFKIIEGEPLQTSYGPDLFDRIFGTYNSALVPAILANHLK